jgi:hypothetical protein
MTEYLTWKKPDYDVGMDVVILAYNDKKEVLGFLRYERLGTYMHWIWYQYKDVGMSPGCLQEVRNKQKELVNKKRDKHDFSWI